MANQMTGQLRVDNSIGGRAQVDTNITPLPSSGIEQAMSQVSATFAGIGERIGQMADKAAATEGTDAGRMAGLDPEFRTMHNGTIRGDAFDKAGLDVHETMLRQQIENDFDGAYAKHAADPTGLNNALAAKQTAILMHAPIELQPELKLLMNGKRLAFSREQARQKAAEAAAEAKAALETQLSDTLKGMHQRAYAMGLDADADAVLGNDVAALAKTLRRRGPDGKALASPEAARKMLEDAKETVATARLSGAFSRLPTLEAKQQFLKQMDEDFAGSKGLSKVYDLQGFDRVRNSLEADLRASRVEHNTQISALKEDVKSFADMAKKGFSPSPAELSGLKSRVAAANDPDTAHAWSIAEDTLAFQSTARKMTPAELDSVVTNETNRIRTDATPHEVARVEMGKELLGKMQTELKQDPLGWADTVGLAKVAPLDASSPQAMQSTVKARIAQAEEIARYYGQEPRYLRPEEKRALATAAAQGGQPLMEMAQALAGAASDRAPKMLAEVGEHAPTVAMLGGHVAEIGATPVARDAADGIALLKTDGVKPMAPSADKSRPEVAAVAGEALRALPKAESAAIALTNAAYEVRARRLGLTDFDSGEWQKAFREVMGERTIAGETYGGVASQRPGWFSLDAKIVVPPNVKQDGVGELVDTLRMDDLVATNGAPLDQNDKPLTLPTVQRSRLVSVGNAQYWLAQGDVEGGDPQWIKGSNGQPYVLDLKALEPVLRKRRPDLYLGGN